MRRWLVNGRDCAGEGSLLNRTPIQPLGQRDNRDVVRIEGDFFLGDPLDHGQVPEIRIWTWSETSDQKNLAPADDESARPPDPEENLSPAARVNRHDFALLRNNGEDA